MSGQRVGYIRVSSIHQNPDRQLEGLELDRTFIDKVSAKDVNRPGLQEMLAFVRAQDTIYVHSMDRLARNLDDLRQIVNTQAARGVRIEFVKEGLSFSGDETPLWHSFFCLSWGHLRSLRGLFSRKDNARSSPLPKSAGSIAGAGNR